MIYEIRGANTRWTGKLTPHILTSVSSFPFSPTLTRGNPTVPDCRASRIPCVCCQRSNAGREPDLEGYKPYSHALLVVRISDSAIVWPTMDPIMGGPTPGRVKSH